MQYECISWMVGLKGSLDLMGSDPDEQMMLTFTSSFIKSLRYIGKCYSNACMFVKLLLSTEQQKNANQIHILEHLLTEEQERQKVACRSLSSMPDTLKPCDPRSWPAPPYALSSPHSFMMHVSMKYISLMHVSPMHISIMGTFWWHSNSSISRTSLLC